MLSFGTNDRLLEALGIKHTILNIEGYHLLKHIAVESMDCALSGLVEMGIFTEEKKNSYLAQAREGGLAETIKDAFRTAKTVLPSDFIPQYNFVPHTDCVPVTHGEIKEIVATGYTSSTIYTVGQLLNELLEMMYSINPMGVNDAVHIFKQAIEQGMPVDSKDHHEQTNAIPPDVRERLLASRKGEHIPNVHPAMVIVRVPAGSNLTDYLLRALGYPPLS